MEEREFSTTASAQYQYWLTQLCDTFIENTKFIFQEGVPEEQQAAAKQTLYTALEGGLLLLHPIMPFVTEHLWQKLPRRSGDTTKSIMVASYPQYNANFDNPKAAAEYEFIMAISQGVRSLLAQYGFKTPGDLFIQTTDPKSYDTAQRELTSIKSLGGKYVGNIEVLGPDNKNAPRGCAVYAVSAEAAVYLKIAGLVDLGKEREKAETQLVEAKEKIKKSEKIMTAKGWEKSSTQAKETEEKKLKDAESEVSRFEEVLKDLERLKM